MAKISNYRSLNWKLASLASRSNIKVKCFSVDNEDQIADGSNHFPNDKSWNDLALKANASNSKFTQDFCFILKCNTAWDKHTLTRTQMSRWDRVRCLCPCHGWHCWTAWHQWSGKTDAGGRNGQRQKNNIHSVVFPAIFRLRCVNQRCQSVQERPTSSQWNVSTISLQRGVTQSWL